MAPHVTTEELLRRWRQAEKVLVDVDRNSLTFRVGRVRSSRTRPGRTSSDGSTRSETPRRRAPRRVERVGDPDEPTTEELLDRWRRAEELLDRTKPGSLAEMLAKQTASEARLAYQERLDEIARERDAGD
jgi:hypothetical protein